ncbi:hypothetical protein SteCoe_27026 [Stentor coeruleus]|uniref:Uncharacterized protein n=1 Tax=Stentor coeruleus TaxID=5963 RepID=A0A1R2BBK8_9CILI|nr:hypothetical protein SteCoe_27026 [Stentor coeruleus]
MGVCWTQDRELKPKENQKVGKLEISEEFRHTLLLTSKQLNPMEDNTRQLLSTYFEYHKPELDANITQLYIDALSCNTESLLQLNFSHYELSLRQVKFLGIVLAYCSEIQVLDLTSTGIENQGLKYITKAFPKIPTLVQISIRKNVFGFEGFQYFSKGIKYLQNLKSVDVSENQIGCEGIVCFAKNIGKCPEVKEIIMEEMGIDENVLEKVKQEIKCQKLEKIRLKGNLEVEGKEAEVLERNKDNSGKYFAEAEKSCLKTDESQELSEA